MDAPKVQPEETITRRAHELVVGDLIPYGYLPLWGKLDGTVLFVHPHRVGDTERIFIAFELPDGLCDCMSLLPDARLDGVTPAPVAEAGGHNYGRGDEGEAPPVTARRVEPHNGAVTEAGLVDETEDERPCYVPNGFQAPEVIAEREADCAARHPARICIRPGVAPQT